jgi:hypothetical protein
MIPSRESRSLGSAFGVRAWKSERDLSEPVQLPYRQMSLIKPILQSWHLVRTPKIGDQKVRLVREILVDLTRSAQR